jgi:hypothetical protein
MREGFAEVLGWRDQNGSRLRCVARKTFGTRLQIRSLKQKIEEKQNSRRKPRLLLCLFLQGRGFRIFTLLTVGETSILLKASSRFLLSKFLLFLVKIIV